NVFAVLEHTVRILAMAIVMMEMNRKIVDVELGEKTKTKNIISLLSQDICVSIQFILVLVIVLLHPND
ncbi:hypothetical protein DERP_012493, partial [Dermatophagoides pteronyssinus]